MVRLKRARSERVTEDYALCSCIQKLCAYGLVTRNWSAVPSGTNRILVVVAHFTQRSSEELQNAAVALVLSIFVKAKGFRKVARIQKFFLETFIWWESTTVSDHPA